MERNINHETAIKYAKEYGWAVFPVRHATKVPLTPHGCTDAKKDLGAINHWWEKWPDAEIGVATGSISGFFVVDLDIDDDKGINGYHELKEWEAINGEFPETVTAITGRGGYHLYYKYDGNDVRNRTSVIDGVDVRGDGGFIIAPPSTHPNGRNYVWETSPEDMPLTPANDLVVDFVKGRKDSSAESFEVPQIIPEGARNDTLHRLACSLQSKGLPDEAIFEAVKVTNKTKCAVPVDDDEVISIVKSALRYKKGEMQIINRSSMPWREPKFSYKVDKDGNITDKISLTIKNIEEAIEYDKSLFGRIMYNEIAHAPYVLGNVPWLSHKWWRPWDNADDSNLRSYIENNYGLSSESKVKDAFLNVSTKRSFNPIKEALEGCLERWDGNKHIENLLPAMLGAEKNRYTAEVMKLFMLGAVSRIYSPGCKFDYMIVLVSDQGIGKSTFLRYLAMDDEWYHDNFNTFDGDKAMEKLRGIWIAEVAELAATRRAKDVETVKSFITSRVDNYRTPYMQRTEQWPRICVFAGTSNVADFLTDRTGNRRFLPVPCGARPVTFDIFKDEQATRHEISQAWGEAMNLFHEAWNSPKLVLPDDLAKEALAMQDHYLEEDTRVGVIQDWLDTEAPRRVCARMVWDEALGHKGIEPTKRETNEIHQILSGQISGWRPVGKQMCKGYGVVKSYEQNAQFVKSDLDELPW